MGKAAKWFRSLIGSKKSPESAPAKEKRKSSKWAFSNSAGSSIKFKNNGEDPLASPYVDGLDANKHAIAVAAATAAVAEAALAAAQAAAEVVRLTSGGGSGSGRCSADRRPVLAAIKIQSAFRAYLARRALRALKGLVKLQALVRGRIVRKQSADMLRRMQAMARIQARASAHRCYTPEYSNARTKYTNSHRSGNSKIRKYEGRSNNTKYGGSLLKQNHSRSPMGNGLSKENSQLASRWLNNWMENCKWNNHPDTCLESGLVDDERTDKILEIDTWKPRQNSKAAPISHYFSAWNNRNHDHSRINPTSRHSSKPNPSISSEEVSSLISSKLPPGVDQVAPWTADNSPRPPSASASSRPARGPFSPARSECSRSFFGDYLGHPSYMANTESSRAKVRSLSAPKQRVPSEEMGWDAKFGHSLWESDAFSEKGSSLSAKQRNNIYGYNSQVKRQGTPTRDMGSGYSTLYGLRH